MYAAAGGASLASRRHKTKHRNTADADALIHQQFQRRFEQHQQQYAPASVEHHLRASSSLTPSTPLSPFGQIRLLGGTFDPAAENKTVTAATVGWPGPVGPSPDSDGTATEGSILIQLPADPHRKWTKKNKIHDAMLFGGDDGPDRRMHELQQGAAANTLLYVGLCSVALGLIIAFVGTGEKGFKTVQLRFIGPGMIAIGACCCAVRIMLCFCPPAFCFMRRRHKGTSDKMAEFYKYMPFRNHPMRPAGTEPLSGGGDTATAVVEAVPMTILKPALKRAPTVDHQQHQTIRMPKATPEASLDSSMEHLIEQDEHLYTKDEVSSNRNLSNLKSTLTFEDSLNTASKMMVKSFEELNTSNCTPSTSDDHSRQELVLSAVNLQTE